jgi:ATP-dependent Lhr-like helicase
MLEILYSKNRYDVLDQKSGDEIESLRKDFSVFAIQDLKTDRPLLIDEKDLQFYTFTGTRINRTIQLLFNIAGIKNNLDDSNSQFEIEIPEQELLAKWISLCQPINNIEIHISELLQSNPTLLDFSKWGRFLPQKFQMMLIKDKYFDIHNTEQFLASIRPRDNH